MVFFLFKDENGTCGTNVTIETNVDFFFTFFFLDKKETKNQDCK